VRHIARALTSAALALMLTAGLLAVGTAAAGAASPADEATFVSKINALRASQGLAALTPDAALAATACTWNDQMIAAGTISHDPNLAAAIASVSSSWRKGGENVGMGGTVDSLFDAFVASPGHYANLVDPQYTRVGVCVGRDANGKLFTTHRFMAVAGDGAAPPPPPPPPPPPAPPPTTAAPPTAPPTTTAAPVTAALLTAPPTTAAPPPPPPPPTTAARITAPVAPPTTPAPAPPTTPAPAPSSLLVAVLPPSSTPAAESTPPAAVDVHELVVEILATFPTFLHLRLP
jgi:Cysteine-rich secretory protein family